MIQYPGLNLNCGAWIASSCVFDAVSRKRFVTNDGFMLIHGCEFFKEQCIFRQNSIPSIPDRRDTHIVRVSISQQDRLMSSSAKSVLSNVSLFMLHSPLDSLCFLSGTIGNRRAFKANKVHPQKPLPSPLGGNYRPKQLQAI